MQTVTNVPATGVAGAWYRASVTLFAAGWLLSGWLMLGSLVKSGRHMAIPGAILPQAICSSCDAVLGSSSAWQLGVPLGGWGLVYFAAIGLLIMFATQGAMRMACVVAAAGTGVSLVLAGQSISGVRICIPCMVVHLVNIGLFASLWIGLRERRSEAAGVLGSMRLGLAIAGFAVVSGALLEVALWTPTASNRKVVAQYQSSTQVDIPIRATDPVLGPKDAPVRLVVFSSFQCPACKIFAEMVTRLHQQYPNTLAIVFKNFPLDTACNPSLTHQMQPRACDAAFAAEAANAQNAFWQYHDLVFHSNLQESEADLVSFAKSAGLDVKRWQADRQSHAAKSAVIVDVVEGAKLKLNGTPSIFLDGREVSGFNYPNLSSLVEQELERSGHPNTY